MNIDPTAVTSMQMEPQQGAVTATPVWNKERIAISDPENFDGEKGRD